ncbi:hypothetical protein CY0110_15882 [Crocosphaera chwakensis CCY0110]|uniref:Uncharacterized protein n=1 Tax=Crocosphaera chwakensis CCY0110 TaxID=391612 RepID=A3IHK8_9CHRO|nr:hypothetical protein CY0110_15882 [Crocosphaera chwakensis CCY0110]
MLTDICIRCIGIFSCMQFYKLGLSLSRSFNLCFVCVDKEAHRDVCALKSIHHVF